jgi:glucosamine kinase
VRVWVGVDAGGTKTRVVAVAADGLVRGDFVVEGADLPTRGAAETEAVLRSIRARIAGVLAPDDLVERVVVGLPGFGEVPGWTAALGALAAAAFAPWPTRAENDVRLAFEAAFAGGHGILVLAGTGSMAWGAAPSGSSTRSGGWGPLFGDEGSAHAIGLAALRGASHALDRRGAATSLVEALPRSLGVGSLWEALGLLERDRSTTRMLTARLAVIVDAEASSGDGVALAILRAAASDLVAHARAVRRQLALEAAATPLAFAGGCFRSRHVRDRFRAEAIGLGFPEPTAAQRQPVYGGVLLAGADAATMRALDAATER